MERIGSVDAREASFGEVVLELPSQPRGPRASPFLGRDQASDAGATLPWTAPAISISAAAPTALDFLLALPADPPPEIVIGDSLRAFGEIAKMALELVARGRVVPVLERGADDAGASWRPELSDPADAERSAARFPASAKPPATPPRSATWPRRRSATWWMRA
jgi:hypothetical protein